MTDTMVSQTAVGAVVNLTGQAQAVSEFGTRDLSIGSEIFQGDTLVTQQSSQMEINFVDHTSFSLGENSESTISSYVYDPGDDANSDFLLEMTKGVFRSVTGEIAKQNPDNFKLKSPMALIGIRGTETAHTVGELAEQHGVVTIGEGHVLVVQDSMGNIQFIKGC